MSMPAVGEPAPDVNLPDGTGEVRRLADQRGRWTVLYFYPADDTPGCTVEACSFRDSMDRLVAEDVTVWGISRDDAASHGRFSEKFSLNFPLLSDPDRSVHEAYGAWGEKLRYGKPVIGVLRSTFIVDPDLRIAKVWAAVKPEGHAEQVLKAIGELRAARAAGV